MMKSKLGIVSLGILVFLLGGVAGFVTNSLYREHINPPQNMFQPTDVIEGIARELNLDSGQKDQLKEIFRETTLEFQRLNEEFGPKYDILNKQYGPKYEELNRIYRPRFDSIRNRSDQKIRDILNPEQKKKFEDFLEKFKAATMQPPPTP
ncbi:MAG: hypothetical protein GXX84_19760 [Acidobacteria bacterium]|mgnify:CR=1 FL=1|nr:hypothetical protein [Acidobacteriota bacterium]